MSSITPNYSDNYKKIFTATYYKSANQNLSNADTDITFDLTANWNNDGEYITHTNGTTNFTVNKAGLYQLEFNISINANGATWNNSINKTVHLYGSVLI